MQSRPNKSNYHDRHAFHKKRTLATGFFNEKKITRANNKQFVSGLRGGLKSKENSGERTSLDRPLLGPTPNLSTIDNS